MTQPRIDALSSSLTLILVGLAGCSAPAEPPVGDPTGGGGSNAPAPSSDFAPPTGAANGPAQQGPWNNRLLTARSSDGLVFERTGVVVTDQGDVPDLVVEASGRIHLYYVGWTVGDEVNVTVVAISDDGGTTWAYKKLELAGFENMSPPVDPDVSLMTDGTFRLYLTADPHDGAGPRTYWADSTDGIHFNYGGTAMAVAGKDVLDPSALLAGDTWHLFAGGMTSGQGACWHGTSSDGRTFADVGESTFEKDGGFYACANFIEAADGYRMYGFRHGEDPSIASFFSPDGVSWSADAGDRLRGDESNGLEKRGVKDPAVAELADGTFLMVYVSQIP
jgi:hypothetical protein